MLYEVITREQFIANAVARLKGELETVGIKNAEVYGRPKHIYSIWNKMRKKGVEFSEVYDVRALRVIVDEIKDCYTAVITSYSIHYTKLYEDVQQVQHVTPPTARRDDGVD